jgi:mono/diheme cytochrome c family protein
MKVSWKGRRAALVLRNCLITLAPTVVGVGQAAESPATGANLTFKQYCVGCHGKATAQGGINLEQLSAQASFGENFQHWERVANALEGKLMPPARLPQPSDAKRAEAVTFIRSKLDAYIQKHAGDPGAVTMRRLTGGEYTYTIRDLTGLDLNFDRDFASDSVGGEGFTNFGDVQFMQDANLERNYSLQQQGRIRLCTSTNGREMLGRRPGL